VYYHIADTDLVHTVMYFPNIPPFEFEERANLLETHNALGKIECRWQFVLCNHTIDLKHIIVTILFVRDYNKKIQCYELMLNTRAR